MTAITPTDGRARSAAARAVLIGSILIAAWGCDKASGTAGAAAVDDGGTSAAAATKRGALLATGDTTDLSLHPDILYQVFGERDDPRLLPVAALSNGRISPLVLSAEGWQRFDSLYHDPGTRYVSASSQPPPRASASARRSR